MRMTEKRLTGLLLANAYDHANFERDLFEALGISEHPKRSVLFRLAWEYGHSAGHLDVWNHALDLVELMGRVTPEALALNEALHPTGHCRCFGEGTCEWCCKPCPGCGAKWMDCECPGATG